MGGYRKREKTGPKEVITEYFHASTQTITAQEIRNMVYIILTHYPL